MDQYRRCTFPLTSSRSSNKTKQILDRMSPSFREYLETLTCEHDANFFHEEARKLGISLNKGPRGNPLNVDTSFKASHPVVRTNRQSLLLLPPTLPRFWLTHFFVSCHRLEVVVRQSRIQSENRGCDKRRIRHDHGLHQSSGSKSHHSDLDIGSNTHLDLHDEY